MPELTKTNRFGFSISAVRMYGASTLTAKTLGTPGSVFAITDARIVDYSVDAAEFVDLVGNCSCPSNGGEVARDYPLGAASRSEGVATSSLVTPVQ
jgi:hypothetical protein